MATARRFEDLEIWKMSAELDVEIFKFIKANDKLSKDFRFRDQILSSSGSIMDNIAEGFERGGTKEFIQFLSISKGSAGELRSQIHRCLNREHISESDHKIYVEKCEAISERISKLMNYLSRSVYKGTKYNSN